MSMHEARASLKKLSTNKLNCPGTHLTGVIQAITSVFPYAFFFFPLFLSWSLASS